MTRRDSANSIHEAAHLVQQPCTNSLSSPTRALTEPLVPVVLALLQSERDVDKGNTPPFHQKLANEQLITSNYDATPVY
jgi:hypothetical protein